MEGVPHSRSLASVFAWTKLLGQTAPGRALPRLGKYLLWLHLNRPSVTLPRPSTRSVPRNTVSNTYDPSPCCPPAPTSKARLVPKFFWKVTVLSKIRRTKYNLIIKLITRIDEKSRDESIKPN